MPAPPPPTAASTASKQSTTSLLTEHFRYTPLTLLDDIINTINELTYRAVDAVQAGLTSAEPSSLGFSPSTSSSPATAAAEIDTGTHQLETLLQASVDRNFDKLEIYVLRSLLRIPDGLENWIRLDHYEGLSFESAASAVDDGSVEGIKRLLALRRQLLETRRLHAALLAEKARNEEILVQLRALLGAQNPGGSVTQPQRDNLSFLTSSQNSTSSHSLQTQATELAAQAPALRKLLQTLRAHLDMQKQVIAGTEQAKPGRQEPEALRERREYIEGIVKGAVERDGGEDGGGGMGKAAGDVQSLEGIRGLVEGRGR